MKKRKVKLIMEVINGVPCMTVKKYVLRWKIFWKLIDTDIWELKEFSIYFDGCTNEALIRGLHENPAECGLELYDKIL